MRAHDAGVNGGGFAPLEASCRRVVGVSWLYWCNFPRLVAPSTWAKLNRVPLTAQFPRLVAARSRFGLVRSRFRAVRRPKCRPPRRKTPTMGCRGRGGLRSGHNGARPRVELARKPLNMRVNPLDTHVNLSTCAWEALPTRISSGPRASQRGPGALRGVQAASMPRRTALPDTKCPHLDMATRSPTHQVRGGIHAPR